MKGHERELSRENGRWKATQISPEPLLWKHINTKHPHTCHRHSATIHSNSSHTERPFKTALVTLPQITTKFVHEETAQETVPGNPRPICLSVCSLKPLLPPQRILLFLGANSERYMTSRLSMESSGDKQSGRHRRVVVTWCNNNTDRATSSDLLPS